MSMCTCAEPTQLAATVNGGQDLSPQASLAGRIAEPGQPLDETIFGKALGGEHGSIQPLRFCHWNAPTYGKQGATWLATVMALLQAGVTAAYIVAQDTIQSKKEDLAERYYDMANYKWNRFAANYLPLELKLLDEVSSVPERQMDCGDDRSRAQGAVTTAFGVVDNYVAHAAGKYRMCLDPAQTAQMQHKKSLALVDLENYNLADDNWFVDLKNDQRWNRRSNVLNLGRNLSSESLKYGDIARSMLDQLGGQVDKAAGALMQAFGYYGTRNDTMYPTTYLSGQTTLIQTGNSAASNPIAPVNPMTIVREYNPMT